MTNPHAEQDALEAAEHAAILDARQKKQAEYEALPPIKRIETWREVAGPLQLGQAMRLLGDALHDWAKEQQK